MPKTTTFKYVSSKSSGSSFSPTSTENTAAVAAALSASASPSPTLTIYSSTAQNERYERMNTKHVNFNGHFIDRSTWLDATDSQPHEAFFYVELLCNIWFIVEFTTRFLVITVVDVKMVAFNIWSMIQNRNFVNMLKTLFTNRIESDRLHLNKATFKSPLHSPICMDCATQIVHPRQYWHVDEMYVPNGVLCIWLNWMLSMIILRFISF